MKYNDLIVDDINQLLQASCNIIMMNGEDVTVKGKLTKELHPAWITVLKPTKRTLLYPHRGNNPFATLFETLWVLGNKCNDIGLLSKFLPRAVNYSDNGKKWRAGYPERIRCATGGGDWFNGEVDQLHYVYYKLKSDPETRQAVMTLWNPMLDCFNRNLEGDLTGELKNSKDFPCSNWVTFLIRNDRLDCTFAIRSNDAIFGMTSINLYEFSVMQEIIARKLGVGVGHFYYLANSLHIYEEHWRKAEEICCGAGRQWGDFLENDNPHLVTQFNIPVFEFGTDGLEFASCLDMITDLLWNLGHKHATEPHIIDNHPMNFMQFSWLNDAYRLCDLYLKYGQDGQILLSEDYYKEMNQIPLSDLKVACHFWMMKRHKILQAHDIGTAIHDCKASEINKGN